MQFFNQGTFLLSLDLVIFFVWEWDLVNDLVFSFPLQLAGYNKIQEESMHTKIMYN